eukprot:365742-Chlamydomonas_euryale.AAC.21
MVGWESSSSLPEPTLRPGSVFQLVPLPPGCTVVCCSAECERGVHTRVHTCARDMPLQRAASACISQSISTAQAPCCECINICTDALIALYACHRRDDIGHYATGLGTSRASTIVGRPMLLGQLEGFHDCRPTHAAVGLTVAVAAAACVQSSMPLKEHQAQKWRAQSNERVSNMGGQPLALNPKP